MSNRRDYHYEVMARLIEGPISSLLYKEMGCTRGAYVRIINNMRRFGVCHIVRWERAKVGNPIAWYGIGAGEDAVFEPIPRKAIYAARNWRRKQATNPVKLGLWGL